MKHSKSPISGVHNSPKAGLIYYMSTYELYYACLLDNNSNVVTYRTQIPYLPPQKNRCRYLDFLVTLTDGSNEAVEIKPKNLLYTPDNQAQLADSAEYAAKNGYKFQIITERELGKSNKTIKRWALTWLIDQDNQDTNMKLMIEKETAIREEKRQLQDTKAKLKEEEKEKREKEKAIATEQKEQLLREINKQDKERYNQCSIGLICFWCAFCQDDHVRTEAEYNSNVISHGKYTCLREQGYNVGKLPKLHLRRKIENGKVWCNDCKQMVPVELFYPDKTRWDNLNRRCKQCSTINCKKRYEQRKKKKS